MDHHLSPSRSTMISTMIRNTHQNFFHFLLHHNSFFSLLLIHCISYIFPCVWSTHWISFTRIEKREKSKDRQTDGKRWNERHDDAVVLDDDSCWCLWRWGWWSSSSGRKGMMREGREGDEGKKLFRRFPDRSSESGIKRWGERRKRRDETKEITREERHSLCTPLLQYMNHRRRCFYHDSLPFRTREDTRKESEFVKSKKEKEKEGKKNKSSLNTRRGGSKE